MKNETNYNSSFGPNPVENVSGLLHLDGVAKANAYSHLFGSDAAFN